MNSIRRLHQKIQDEASKRNQPTEDFMPSDELPDFGEIQINTSVIRGMYGPEDLIYLDSTKLIEPETNLYFYNAGFYENDEKTYRMFYRCGKNPKGYEDRIATCLLDRDLNILVDTNKYIDVHSSWHETTGGKLKFKLMIPFLFKNGVHVEDPRAIRCGTDWFVLYTDGITMGVAKLDEDCNVLYSHYLQVPSEIVTKDSDGREKNWIPIKFEDGFLHLLYSESPRILFKYRDRHTHLELVKTRNFPMYQVNWDHGYVRGGCPPLQYKKDKYIWFFHSVKKMPTYINEHSRVYMIGAYITESTYPYIPLRTAILPVIIGWPSNAIAKVVLQDNVVFPCGAIRTGYDVYTICMGINDYRIAYLKVNASDLLWKSCGKSMKLGILDSAF